MRRSWGSACGPVFVLRRGCWVMGADDVAGRWVMDFEGFVWLVGISVDWKRYWCGNGDGVI